MANKSSGSEKIQKSRYWAGVIYPESLPDNWREIIKLSGLRCAVSPLHKSDKNADYTEKKPHYHIIACWEGPTTLKSVSVFFVGKLHGVSPQLLHNVNGMYRYFTHKDNPEKAQYDEKDIQTFNGFNIADYVEITRLELLKIKQELFAAIRKENLVEYSDFVDYCVAKMPSEYVDVAVNHTILFDRYLSSIRHKAESEFKMALSRRPRADIDKAISALVNSIDF